MPVMQGVAEQHAQDLVKGQAHISACKGLAGLDTGRLHSSCLSSVTTVPSQQALGITSDALYWRATYLTSLS